MIAAETIQPNEILFFFSRLEQRRAKILEIDRSPDLSSTLSA
jgi:hypothetical protein